jgi:hypothetical protein
VWVVVCCGVVVCWRCIVCVVLVLFLCERTMRCKAPPSCTANGADFFHTTAQIGTFIELLSYRFCPPLRKLAHLLCFYPISCGLECRIDWIFLCRLLSHSHTISYSLLLRILFSHSLCSSVPRFFSSLLFSSLLFSHSLSLAPLRRDAAAV